MRSLLLSRLSTSKVNNLSRYSFSTSNLVYNSSNSDLVIDYLKQTFAEFHKPNHYEYLLSKNKNLAKITRASVLVPISVKSEKNSKGNYIQKTFFTLSRRTETMNSHKGQVSFVGGKRDKTDSDDVMTAYREASEEVGIESKDLTLLAQMCPIITSSGFLVTPVIAYFDNSSFKPVINPNEVEMIFELPTERFLSTEGHNFKPFKSKNTEYYIHYFDDIVNGNIQVNTWGLTALMSVIISTVLHSRAPNFELDPEVKLTNENVNEFLEAYLLGKSKPLIDRFSK